MKKPKVMRAVSDSANTAKSKLEILRRAIDSYKTQKATTSTTRSKK